MAVIVCHGLQLSLESQLVESRIHSVRLHSPKAVTPKTIDCSFKSCLLKPNTNSKPHCEATKESMYVPPQVKLSWMQLSPKSLEVCTENLGNETGSDMKESNIELLCSRKSGGGNLESKDERKSSKVLEAKKAKSKSFPPPLTTMRGSESLRVRAHREGGRLVIEVTKVPGSGSWFQAERSHGRLRLCFWSDREEEEEEEEEEEDDIENEEEEEVVDEDEIKNEGGGEGERGVSSWNIGNESEVRIEKYERERRRRCKEGGGHESWGEPLWVATS